MEADPRVIVLGLGVPDPKGVFGTTLGLREKYGPARVLDTPCSENAMTGVGIGAAILGVRPVLVHQRLDFSLLAAEPIINQAAKWHFMFAGRMRVPLVIRLIVGRGWGQGPQHSQSLQALFAHVPGLKVVMPSTPSDAKGLLISAIEDDNPVIFIEHRWLHSLKGPVPPGPYRVPIGQAAVLREGIDLTVIADSYLVPETLKAADALAPDGVSLEVVDIRTLRPLDEETILSSARKTGRVVVAETGTRHGGFAAEILARISESAFSRLKCPPRRLTPPDAPTPASPSLSEAYYPRAVDLVRLALAMLEQEHLRSRMEERLSDNGVPRDVPDRTFAGPF